MKMLFSEGLRTDPTPRRRAETTFAFLKRSSHPVANAVRRLLEEWFRVFPVEGQDELAARIRSGDNVHFTSAFFELYLNALLSKLGYVLEVHPLLDTDTEKRPDFLVKYEGAPVFLLEAVVATEMSQEERGVEATKSAFFDALDSLDSPNFFLHIRERGELTTTPPSAKLKRELVAWLSSLDPDSYLQAYRERGRSALPSWEFEHEGWRITFRAFPKSPGLRGKADVRTIGFQTSGFTAVRSADAIRKVLKRKISRYGELSMPYVVAVNAREVHVDDIAITEALFGTEAYTFPIDETGQEEEAEFSRATDGVWSIPGKNTRVSAVLMVKTLHPTTVGVATARLYHNPNPARPCTGPICTLPQALVAEDEVTMIPGILPSEVLKIDPNWLEEEQ